MIKKWQTVSRTSAGDFRIFEAHFVDRIHPILQHESRFIVLNSNSWVNIVPITADGQVVFIRQYRHGVDDVTLEIPGGLVEAGEDPMVAGMRECVEETGFLSTDSASLLGVQHPNPAFLNNQCFSFVWFNCESVVAQALDKNEDIEVVLRPLSEVPELIRSGEVTHSLVLNAFMFYWLKYPASQILLP